MAIKLPTIIITKLIEVVPQVVGAIAEAVRSRRSSIRPAPQPTYNDPHSWTRFAPWLPPQTCIYCKQPRAVAEGKPCPGVLN